MPIEREDFLEYDFFDREDSIDYEISNGVCTYCGKEADYQELPDGSWVESGFCEYCDSENMETWLINSVKPRLNRKK